MKNHIRRLVVACGILAVLLGSVYGSDVIVPRPPRPPVVPPFVPTLQVRGAEQPVRLKTMALTITIQGGFAEVEMDMTFFNPNRRVLEGELRFPLLPGQEISGLALDIEGEMRRGVPVPKARGQEIFDSVVRRNVDPALLEAAEGNVYKLRVYPIPATGTRRVMVRVLHPLDERDGMAMLSLPLAFAKHLEELTVEAVVATEEKPRVEAGSLGLTLRQEGMLYRGRVEKRDFSPEGVLSISVPASAAVERSGAAVRWGGRLYFTAAATVALQSEKRNLPDLVTLVWDASGSGRNRDHAKEYALLDRYFAAMGEGRVRLVVVRDRAEAAREFSVRNGDWNALKAVLHELAYDGGTDLAAWKPTDDCREYLLFSDGIVNFGASLGDSPLPVLSAAQRLYAVTASVEADHALLRHAAEGRVVDLLQNDADMAVNILLEEGTVVCLPPAELAGKGEVALDPSAFVAAGEEGFLAVRLAGWIAAGKESARETVNLLLRHPGGKEERLVIALPFDNTLPVHDGEDAPLAARLWGRYAIAAMEANAKRHKAAIARLGQELGIVSRETSLIVLETAADYATYDVTPPAALKAEVERFRAANATTRTAVVAMPVDRLARLWAEKVAWWEKDFSAKRPPKKTARNEDEAYASADGNVLNSTMSGIDAYSPRQETEMSYSVAEEMSYRARDALSEPRMMERHIASTGEMAAPVTAMGAAAAAPRNEPHQGAARPEAPAAKIALQSWQSDAPYIDRMNRAKKEDMYAIYLDKRPGFEQSSAFYLDMADRLFTAGMPELGMRVLTNLAEIGVENRQLLRVLAYRLMEAGEAGPALGILEKVRELAPYEPQSLRDIALAHVALGNRADAADLFYTIATRQWDSRFGDINTIALTELNALLAVADGVVDVGRFDSRLVKNLASDLRVVLAWDADNTDMDLWVTGPDGEKCYYQNRLTRRGGAMSSDCTDGYGPEEFMLRKAAPGVYRVEVDYYGNHRQVISGDVTVYVTFITGFGMPEQKEQMVTLRLRGEKKTVLAGEFTVE